jgi:hypothetical protein
MTVRRGSKSRGWAAVHCRACGHHNDEHGDYGECTTCMDEGGPCQGDPLEASCSGITRAGHRAVRAVLCTDPAFWFRRAML